MFKAKLYYRLFNSIRNLIRCNQYFSNETINSLKKAENLRSGQYKPGPNCYKPLLTNFDFTKTSGRIIKDIDKIRKANQVFKRMIEENEIRETLVYYNERGLDTKSLNELIEDMIYVYNRFTVLQVLKEFQKDGETI